jgi:DNA-binding transcriptional MerR regulator
LRYWETRFEQLRPLQRAGNRRYYRPADVELARRIHRLLNEEGYTIRGVQQLLAQRGTPVDEQPTSAATPARLDRPALPLDELRAIRRTLAEALEQSAV